MTNVRKIKQPQPPQGRLTVAVETAVAGMTWLTASDRGMVELALEYARRIDAADSEKTFGWLGPHLANVLRSLGGSPAERKALGVEDVVRGKLAEIRAARR